MILNSVSFFSPNNTDKPKILPNENKTTVVTLNK